MSRQSAETAVSGGPCAAKETAAHDKPHERRATVRAGVDWRDACQGEEAPTLTNLGIGDTAEEWHDRFLIRSNSQMAHAIFIACGNTLKSKSHWNMARTGTTLQDALPDGLRDRFADGCQKSLDEGCPVTVEGSYHDEGLSEFLFRCVMMPVQALNNGADFVYGAYSHKIAA